MSSTISNSTVHHIAQLATIPITTAEESTLASAFSDTLDVIAHMSELDTSKVEPTHQVTGLENVLRDDVVTNSQTFTQEEALANAHQQANGYFKVPQVIDQE